MSLTAEMQKKLINAMGVRFDEDTIATLSHDTNGVTPDAKEYIICEVYVDTTKFDQLPNREINDFIKQAFIDGYTALIIGNNETSKICTRSFYAHSYGYPISFNKEDFNKDDQFDENGFYLFKIPVLTKKFDISSGSPGNFDITGMLTKDDTYKLLTPPLTIDYMEAKEDLPYKADMQADYTDSNGKVPIVIYYGTIATPLVVDAAAPLNIEITVDGKKSDTRDVMFNYKVTSANPVITYKLSKPFITPYIGKKIRLISDLGDVEHPTVIAATDSVFTFTSTNSIGLIPCRFALEIYDEATGDVVYTIIKHMAKNITKKGNLTAVVK